MSLDQQVLDFCPPPRLMPPGKSFLTTTECFVAELGTLAWRTRQISSLSGVTLQSLCPKGAPRQICSPQADTVPLSAFVHQYPNMPSISNAGLINLIARERAGGLGLEVYIFSYNQKCLAYHGHSTNSMRLLKRHKY